MVPNDQSYRTFILEHIRFTLDLHRFTLITYHAFVKNFLCLYDNTSIILRLFSIFRFMLWAWWFFVLIIVSMYTANLTAFLTLKRVGVDISEITDLLYQDTYKWGVIKDRNIESRLLNHIDPRYHELAIKGEMVNSLTEAQELVKEGRFVFIDEGSVIDYHFRDECDYIPISSNMESNEWAYGLPIYSPYTNIINTALLKYKETEKIFHC